MERILTYTEALREATEQEMDRDSSVFVIGIGVDDHTAIYGTTKGLVDRFGSDRVVNTPLSEDAMTGAAIGAALAGLRPIHVHIRMDFVLLAMNQLVNIAAKSRYMFGESGSVPLVVRCIIGRGWGQGAQHSQALHPYFMHIPGFKVVAPTTAYDAKGCMIESIRDNNPVIFVEHRMLYGLDGPVPEEPYTVPFGKARIFQSGTDITLVGVSHMVLECLRAARYLESVGVSAEVIDPVSLSPLDIDTVVESARKTKNLMVVDNAWPTCGASAEILVQAVEALQNETTVRISRMGFAPVPCPTTKNLENLFYPNSQTIASRAFGFLHDKKSSWFPEFEEAAEITAFKGPF